MEGEIDVNAKLDYASFQISSTQNRYEVVICSKGRTEKLASGSLDQLSQYLLEAKQFQSDSSNGTFILEPKRALRGSSWFNKSTLAIFLHIVGSPEALLSASGTVSEMSQLEETRKFHLSLYSKDDLNHVDVGLAGGLLKDIRVTEQMRGETISSDATKNELLQALELRLTALKEDMVTSLNRAAGSILSTKHISDLIAFSQHFGAMELRNLLANYLAMISTNQPAELSRGPLQLSYDSKEMNEYPLETSQSYSQAGNAEHVVISPAKLAQVERMSPTESGESSDWSDEDQRAVERSRSFVRTAPHRRSASPMRRIQIGRSGSRRSTALTIKSLNLFPARERISINRDTDGDNENGDEEFELSTKKPESTVRMMSVRDAISLFESKQKDQSSDTQKRASGDASNSTNKSVLRRWSAGTSDSLAHRSQERRLDAASESTSFNLLPEEEEKKVVEVNVESAAPENSLDPPEIVKSQVDICPPISSPMDLVNSQQEEIGGRSTGSAEWNRQREAELNQMLMKMMESQPGKHRDINEIFDEPKGDFYAPYKEKRDEKLKAESVGKQATKEARNKVLQKTLGQRKAETAIKKDDTTRKNISLTHSQRAWRNSAPPVLSTKEASKTAAPRRPSLNSPLPPAARSSRSSVPSPKSMGVQPHKSYTGSISTRLKKTQTSPSSVQPSPKAERSTQQVKAKRGTLTHNKPAIEGRGDPKLSAGTKSRNAKTVNKPALDYDSNATANPKFSSRVTKKSSGIPVEQKTLLRKGAGTGPAVSPSLGKSKDS
ncbi:uncharacterized protein LOC109708881 [Ananas comosus]|uniref:Uncharacterized protein LOC109708881 n=1 Tax=Ananas comosus TaxID=4615 RepID=A0A6P5ES90_ANACO|nr:uncharacterized protein LOC109708881 [Ananas comosus]